MEWTVCGWTSMVWGIVKEGNVAYHWRMGCQRYLEMLHNDTQQGEQRLAKQANR